MKMLQASQINSLIRNTNVLNDVEEKETVAILFKIGLLDRLSLSREHFKRLNTSVKEDFDTSVVDLKIEELENQKLIMESINVINDFLKTEDDEDEENL